MSHFKSTVVRAQSYSDQDHARTPTLNSLLRFSGCAGSRSAFKGGSVVAILEEQELSVTEKDVRGADSGTMSRPLTDSPINNLEREKQLMEMKRALARASSDVPGSRVSFTTNATRPSPTDFQSWPDVDLFHRTPNSPELPKKPVYRRTWFACTIIAILLALLLATILALAFTRSVNHKVTSDSRAVRGNSSASALHQQNSTNSSVTTPEVHSLPELILDVTTARPEVSSTSPAVQITTTESIVSNAETTTTSTPDVVDESPGYPRFFFMISLSRPVQDATDEDVYR